jgi:hypothetical protein
MYINTIWGSAHVEVCAAGKLHLHEVQGNKMLDTEQLEPRRWNKHKQNASLYRQTPSPPSPNKKLTENSLHNVLLNVLAQEANK